MTIIGLARHHFHGSYSATIALKFPSPEACAEALPSLQTEAKVNFVQSPAMPEGAIVKAGKPDLDLIMNKLVELGADEKKILSLAKSVDRGEQFTIEL